MASAYMPKPLLPCHLGARCVQTCVRVVVMPEEERLAGLDGAFHEVIRAAHQLFVHIGHVELGLRVHIRTRRQRAGIFDCLLASRPQRGSVVGVVLVGGSGVNDVARTELREEISTLREVVFLRLLHGVEMIENAVELVEAMHGGQIFVAVTEMVLADLRGNVAMRLEQLGDRGI